MNENSSAASAFGAVAFAFEQMNEVSRTFRKDPLLKSAITHCDVRFMISGWLYEKYISVAIKDSNWQGANWHLEISFTDDVWLVVTENSIDHSDYYREVERVSTRTVEGLPELLKNAVSNLAATATVGTPFRKEIERLSCGTV